MDWMDSDYSIDCRRAKPFPVYGNPRQGEKRSNLINNQKAGFAPCAQKAPLGARSLSQQIESTIRSARWAIHPGEVSGRFVVDQILSFFYSSDADPNEDPTAAVIAPRPAYAKGNKPDNVRSTTKRPDTLRARPRLRSAARSQIAHLMNKSVRRDGPTIES
jgi:hypothetical protein